MANHLTPTELARESGLERRDVIMKCVELGVPIFNGRIDKTLFLSSLREVPGAQQTHRVLAMQTTHSGEFVQDPSSLLPAARTVPSCQRSHQLFSCRHADPPHLRPRR